MEECNKDPPMPGDNNDRDNRVRVPVCRSEGNSRQPRHPTERKHRETNRGYRTDPRPPRRREDEDFRRGAAADNSDHRGRYDRENRRDDRNRRYDSDDRYRHYRDDRYSDRDERYNRDRRRKGDEMDDFGRSGRYRERSDSGYRSDDYDDFGRDSRRSRRDRDSFRRGDRRQQRSRDFRSDEDDYHDDDDDEYHRKESDKRPPKKEKEWPPSFQKDGSAFTFDTRSAMFYEPLSDFFYDPKSKLYYGNKKCAYFRYDEKEDPPYVEVQKVTKEQQEQQGESIAIDVSVPAALPSTPKIAIKFKTKTVKSSKSTLAAQKCDKQQPQQQATVSKAKQQQIANIGKWNEKQAQLKEEEKPQTEPQTKIRTTAKGEPICMLCKKKFPNLAKLRLHEKASELHQKNLLALEEKRAKRKAAEYTDRAEKRRQLHGTDLGGSQAFAKLPPPPESTASPAPAGADLNENNLGHKMLQKMGYPGSTGEASNEHLRKEWDRIEAMAQKSVPRNR